MEKVGADPGPLPASPDAAAPAPEPPVRERLRFTGAEDRAGM
jgi:hypothetical protein